MDLNQGEIAAPQPIQPVTISLSAFVSDLKKISDGVVSRNLVMDYLRGRSVDRSDLESYVHWSPEKYTRNLIFRNAEMEMILICWNIGSTTPLHTHNGQLGWMSMIQGQLQVENFRLVSCNRPENMEVVGMDCLAGATQITMKKLNDEFVRPGGPLNTVDKHQTTHRITNQTEWNEPAMSLHIYSRPIDSCVVFDLEAQRCFRRDMSYDY